MTYFIIGTGVAKRKRRRKPAAAKRGSTNGIVKPLHSEALAVNPKQIPEAIEDARKKGVPTDFDKLGRPIFTSRAHAKAYQKAYGYFNRDAGYGDAQPGQSRTFDLPPPPDPATLYGDAPIRITREGQEQMVREIMRGRR